jgi:hypothetical protein
MVSVLTDGRVERVTLGLSVLLMWRLLLFLDTKCFFFSLFLFFSLDNNDDGGSLVHAEINFFHPVIIHSCRLWNACAGAYPRMSRTRGLFPTL